MAQEASGAIVYMSSKRHEWWGWFGCALWLFYMMYGFDMFMYPEALSEEGSMYAFFFMHIFALSVAGFAWKFGNNPGGLSAIARFTAPIAIAITALCGILPEPLGPLLYTVSPVFMAPALTRRLYGVIRAAEGKPFTYYMSGITVAVTIYTLLILLMPPKEIAFLVTALCAVPAWIGIGRAVTVPKPLPPCGAFKFSRGSLLALVAASVLLIWLNTMSVVIHSDIVFTGLETFSLTYTLLGFVLPPTAFLLYGIIADKGHERTGFICGMSLFIIGILLALMSGDNPDAVLLPLAITDGLGASYTEYLMLTIPVYFLIGTKRPVFSASLGLALNFFHAAFMWRADLWLPEIFMGINPTVLVSAAISAIAFITLAHFLFERRKERSLAAALIALMRNSDSGDAAAVLEDSPEEVTPEDVNETENMVNAGLSKEEAQIAMLLIEGSSRSEITRKLRLTSAETDGYMRGLREKIGGRDYDPVISQVVKRYKLTGSETKLLRCLREGMTNPQAAEELYISENTVKTQMRSLMRKLPIEDRKQIPNWLEEYDLETS